MSEYIVDIADNPSFGGVLITCGEIVRCRDCEHFEKTVQFGICHRSEFLPMWAELNGYCAWPERKESGE
ncbi:MAG: hypothetical protein IKP01_02095 [Bacteroidales bacterium]|nr:hypothetical protein [Bacteroidales bacterium]